VVVLRNLVNPALLEKLAEAVELNLAEPGEWASDYTPSGSTGRFFGDYVNWPRIDGYRHAALDSSLPFAARQLMRSTTARFFHEHVLVKEPSTTEITPWHHDEPYYCVDGAQNVSLWISLDPVPKAAGVEFVVGSHLWGRRFVPRRFVDSVAYAAADSGFELVPDIDANRDEHEIVSFDIEPGDVLAFQFSNTARSAGYGRADSASSARSQPALPRRRRRVRPAPVASFTAVRAAQARAW
jgi:ectoine hydroxylase-related dioxygenase (phytanoyl-CoA dioxygenase family)